MLAIAPQPGGIICVRCSFRRRLLALQQRRRQSTAAEVVKGSVDTSIRYTDRPSERLNESRIRYYAGQRIDKSAHRARAIESDGIIRKFVKSDGLGQWGLDARSVARNSEKDFRETLLRRLQIVKFDVKDAPLLEQVTRDTRRKDGKKELRFNRLWRDFAQRVLQSFEEQKTHVSQGETQSSLWNDLVSAWKLRGESGLDDRIKYAFYGYVINSRFSESDIRNQQMLADLRYPAEWFPATRALQRTVHLHVGPTNSGKTFQALQRLERATHGVYAGPLRLLAHEVYSRMNAKGKPCSLITGEERRFPETANADASMSACTVEMMPLNKTLDVAVIDEIQMIGNAERGWAWTQALLGVKAKEVHLCGEERTVPLIKELCASIGDKLEVHRYKRLSPLRVADQALDGDLKRLRKGDCIVSFSVMGIHALRRQIEQATGRKVATVYGSLPPETRAQQARLFNDPDNDYDFLVASDAVGMGLNLAIKRIIFETSSKFDGLQRRTLSIADVKQIGGRAGRFRTAAQANEAPLSEQDLATAKGESHADQRNVKGQVDDDGPENVGLVTTLERFDYPIVRAAMESEPEPMRTAGIFPPAPILERFASYFPPGTPFSYMLTRLHELSQMHERFHLCGLKDQVWIADLIEPVEGLTVSDRNIICSSPASKSDYELWKDLMPAYARCIAQQSGGSIVDIQELPLETLEAEGVPNREYLRDLERLHKGIVTYLWLSYRFAGIFTTRPLAFHVKGLVEENIEHVLGQFSFSEIQRRKVAARREKEIIESLLAAQQASHQGVEVENVSGESSLTTSMERDLKSRKGEAEDILANSSDLDQYLKVDHKEPEIGEELDGKSEEVSLSANLDEQTSLTAGGDRFGGEVDLRLGEPEFAEQRAPQDVEQLDVDSGIIEKTTRSEVETPHTCDNSVKVAV